MAKGIVTKANMVFFKRMASPMMKDKMLEGMAEGFVDYVKDERKEAKCPQHRSYWTGQRITRI